VSQQKEDQPAVPAASPMAAGEAAGGAVRGPAGDAPQPANGQPAGPAPGRWWRRPRLREAVIIVAFLAAGVAATWPRAMFLTGTLPAGDDQAEYVWNMWWIAHQITHLGNPWFTSYLAAPLGDRLGFDTLTPLLGAVMTPVTLLLGPSVSYDLLVILAPGLAGYAMYRLARLWLPGLAGPLAAGAFFGLSGMVTFQAWAHIHTAAGIVLLPLTVEAAVRLRRGPTIRRGVILGIMPGAAMLIDQEFAVLAVILAALVLLPWLVDHHGRAQLRALAAAAVTTLVISLPQLVAMAVQLLARGSRAPTASDYLKYAAQLPGLFAPSPRLADYGATGIGSIYQVQSPGEGLATFGVVLSLLAVLGLVVSWRRRSAWLLALLWLGGAALALGPTLVINGHQYVPLPIHWRGLGVSLLMPYTWMIHLPGLSSFREAERLALLGLVGAALLAGAAVEWLRQHAPPVLIGVVLFGALEAGWPGVPHPATMPTTLAAVDRPIAADHSGSLVVDVPFGIIGVPSGFGDRPSPLALVLATADGHPRAASYTSWTITRTVAGIQHHPFYYWLVAVRLGDQITPAGIANARRDARKLHVGWVLVWQPRWMSKLRRVGSRYQPDYHYPAIYSYLGQVGFHFAYQADGVVVYRP
jgi:hypothetical protein